MNFKIMLYSSLIRALFYLYGSLPRIAVKHYFYLIANIKISYHSIFYYITNETKSNLEGTDKARAKTIGEMFTSKPNLQGGLEKM